MYLEIESVFFTYQGDGTGNGKSLKGKKKKEIKTQKKMEEKGITSRAVTSLASMLNLNLVVISRLVIIYQYCL